METERLLLRQWRDEDLVPFAALNADPEVMEFFPAPLTPEQSADLAGRHQALLEAGEPGLFATEVRATGEFIGFVGLAVPKFEAAFTPCVEVGWRLARSAWGQGYATEAAGAVLEHGFNTLMLNEIVSFTAAINLRSRAVMERIGMTRDPADDFDHPSIPPGDRLSWHVLYRVSSPSSPR
jgi:RimJ/RimL family protein N-acetyltransferase